jgi:aminopeptidase-like protein
MRTPHGQYPEYHSSADDLNFVQAHSLAQSYVRCLEVFELLEHNRTYVNQNQKCEPQLGRRGLYRSVAGQQDQQAKELALLWVLNASDGHHTLFEIAERANLPFRTIQAAAEALLEGGLLKEYRSAAKSEPSDHPK